MTNRYTASYADHRVIQPADKFEKFGAPGAYHSMETVATTQTGSFTEHGAFMMATSADSATTKIFVQGGGVFNGSDLPVETIFDIAPSSIQATGGNIYVFKRQQ